MNCVETVNHSKVKVEENKCKAVFLNPLRKSMHIGRIDGCIIQEGIRADYFVSDEDHIAFVELKGCDIDHACKQLFAAVAHPNMKGHISGKKKAFVIICSRVPQQTTSVQLAQAKAMRLHGAALRVYCKEREMHLGKI